MCGCRYCFYLHDFLQEFSTGKWTEFASGIQYRKSSQISCWDVQKAHTKTFNTHKACPWNIKNSRSLVSCWPVPNTYHNMTPQLTGKYITKWHQHKTQGDRRSFGVKRCRFGMFSHTPLKLFVLILSWHLHNFLRSNLWAFLVLKSNGEFDP